MSQRQAFGGAVTITQCDLGDVVLRQGDEAAVAAVLEFDTVEPLQVDVHWHDSGGAGVKLDAEGAAESVRVDGSIPYETAAEVWGPGTTQVFLTIEMAVGAEPPPRFRGGPNDPLPCGTISVE